MPRVVATLLATLALALTAASAGAAERHDGSRGKRDGAGMSMTPARLGALVVEQAWARASLTANGAAYVTVRNTGKATDQLIGVRTPVAKRAELHTHLMDKGIMRMRPLKAIELSPGAPAVMRPGSDHIMLMGLKRKLKRGERFPITLRFARAGELTVMVAVMGPGARGPEGGDGSRHGDHGADKKRTH